MGACQVVYVAHVYFRGCARRKRAAVNYSLDIRQDPRKGLVGDLVVNTPVEPPAPGLQLTVSARHRVKDCVPALIHRKHPNALKWPLCRYHVLRYQASPDDVAHVPRLVSGNKVRRPNES